MRRIVAGLWVAAALAQISASVTPAAADTIFDDLRSGKGLTVTVGAVGAIAPSYEGSNHYLAYGAPIFNIRPVGSPPRFFTPRENFGVTIFEFGGWQFGPSVAFNRIRSVRTEPVAFNGFDDSKLAVELGAFAEKWFTNWLRYRVELRQGVTAGQGFIADQSIDVVQSFGPWQLSAGPRMRIVDDRANSRSFDITPLQQITSGITAYDAGGGVRSVGAGTQALYRFNPQWAVHAFIEYDRLVGDAGNSSLVKMRGATDQWLAGAGFQYSFDWVMR
jgi:outer membrane protein